MQDLPFTDKICLLHSPEDKSIVEELATWLEEDGFEVWLDEWTIQAGDSISLKTKEGLEQSRVLILCMSRHLLASDQKSLEPQTSVFRDPATNKGRSFIPLLLEECEIPQLLKQYAYMDWSEKSRKVYHELMDAFVYYSEEDLEFE